ncbi:MAG TPA: sugar ABC transporter ATP-binding protein [Streptosporangiaceae bacterium]
MTATETTTRPAGPIESIAAEAVSKRYGAVEALRDASFSARPGEVHALVGENGAGKSTLIKTLCGVTQPDSGAVRAFGERVRLRDPEAARRRGIGTVFQDLTLLPWLTVAENLLLRREPRGALGLIRRRELGERAARLLADYHVADVTSIDPYDLVADLSLAQRQLIEIVRAVSHRPQVLFLDEPTSSLAEREVEWLFRLVRGLRDDGTCVVFTSHRWREVASLADRITVFRNGRHVATRDHLDEREAVRLMTGRGDIDFVAELPAAGDRPALEVSGLTGGRLSDVSFTLHEGEILGVGGLEGQGQRELFLTLFGVHRGAGEIRVGGEPVRLHSPRDAIRAGVSIALVPEDRKGEGLFLPMSVQENLTLPILGRIAVSGLLRPGAERATAGRIIERMRITLRNPAQAVGTLSGGNQQKVLIGRWLLADARILLFYDVTRGVDVATKNDVYRLMLELAAEGRSILYYSSDTEEVARLAHRVLVLREGKVAAELRGPGVAPEDIVSTAVGEVVPAHDD